MSYWNMAEWSHESNPESKERSVYTLRTCFVAADYWFLVFSMILKSATCSCTSDLVTW